METEVWFDRTFNYSLSAEETVAHYINWLAKQEYEIYDVIVTHLADYRLHVLVRAIRLGPANAQNSSEEGQ